MPVTVPGSTAMLTDVILLLARLLMAALFVAGGIPKLMGDAEGREAIAALGLPAAALLERMAGLCLVAGAAMLVLGLWARLAAALLAAFVVVVTPLFLRFWNADNPFHRAKMIQAFVANMGITGGLLAFVAVGPGGLALLPST